MFMNLIKNDYLCRRIGGYSYPPTRGSTVLFLLLFTVHELNNGTMKRKHYDVKEGDRFGLVVVIKKLPKRYANHRNEYEYLCKCDCGNEFIVGHNRLTTGYRKSCGCLVGLTGMRNFTIHGMTKNPLYKIWLRIKERCLNVKSPSYKYYGGRGITLYPSWIDDPIEFIIYLKSLNGWNDEKLTLDRIDNNGNYEPNNLRFVEKSVQAANQGLRKDNKSGYKGIWYDKQHNFYRVTVGRNNGNVFLGIFRKIEDAINARNEYIVMNDLQKQGFNIQTK